MAAKEKRPQPGRRQIVKFTFFKVDQGWRSLPAKERARATEEFCRAVEDFASRLVVRSYTLMGMRGDADFLLWQIGDRLEDIQELATHLFSTAMGPHLSVPYSYLAMTRRSLYVTPEGGAAGQERTILQPGRAKYLFVYPFVKTRAWYRLSKAARQGMMDEHIAVGRKYPSVKLNTTYSYGLDDQEFVVAFETDEPADFLDLVMDLRETEASMYTLRDTPTFSCIAMGLRETLDSLGAPGGVVRRPGLPAAGGDDSWLPVAQMAELPLGACKVVHFQGEQTAVFNVEGQLYAVDHRCSHANGPLGEGRLEGTVVTCPWHGSRFDLRNGQPLDGPAHRPLVTYQVKAADGVVYLAADRPQQAPGAP